jgi:hypothetical protein
MERVVLYQKLVLYFLPISTLCAVKIIVTTAPGYHSKMTSISSSIKNIIVVGGSYVGRVSHEYIYM